MSKFNNIPDAEKDLMKKILNVSKATATQVFKDIVINTPVDTGRAQRNWHASTGTPSQSIDGDTGDIEQEINAMRLEDTVYLANNLPYIEPLEQGHSQQQPSGWVRSTVAKGQAILDKLAKKIQEDK